MSSRVTHCEHTDRKHRARGLCGSCYVMGKPGREPLAERYGDYLVEELEHAIRTWPDLEAAFDRPRHRLMRVLSSRGERGKALIRQVHIATYGVATQREIKSVLRAGKAIGEP